MKVILQQGNDRKLVHNTPLGCICYTYPLAPIIWALLVTYSNNKQIDYELAQG